MNETESSNFYWSAVSQTEEYIQTYGQHSCADWEGRSHQDLVNANLKVQPFLKAVSKRRMFYNLPGNLNSFAAENFHDALIQVLNPPERWFRQLEILSSPEYLALKKGAEDEGIQMFDEHSKLKKSTKFLGNDKRSERSSRRNPKVGEFFSEDAIMLLAYLKSWHGCTSDTPNYTPYKTQTKVAEDLAKNRNGWNQPRVSISLKQLMEKVRIRCAHSSPQKMYEVLCNGRTICDVLVSLEIRSMGKYEPLQNQLKEMDHFSDRGF